MAIDDILVTDESSLDLDEKSGLNPWLIFGALLFVVAFILGWRKIKGKKKNDTSEAIPTSELP